MNSHYFSQHIINKGILPFARVKKLLRDSSNVEPGLQLKAVAQGLVTADQLDDLAACPIDVFKAQAVERGFLTETQMAELSETITGESMSFAQAMLNDGFSLAEVETLLKGYDENTEMPICEAIGRIIGAELDSERPMYEEFTDIFMSSLGRFIGAAAVINVSEPFQFDSVASSHIVSQVLVGDINLVTGLYAVDDVYKDIACRYSCEQFTEMNELAIDSVMEYFNVINGLYTVELAKREIEADLETPTVAENIEPMGSNQLVVPIETGFGSFALIMATDEFIFG